MTSLQVPGSVLAREGNRDQSPARPGGRAGSTQYAAPPLGALKRVGTSRDISKPGAADDAAAAKQAVDSTSEIEVLLTSEEAKNDPLKDLIVLPADDIIIDTMPKNQRTDFAKRAGLTDEEVTQLEPAQQSAFTAFSADWKWFSHHYASYARAEGEAIADLPGEVFEEDPAAALAQRKNSLAMVPQNSSGMLPSVAAITIPEQDIIAARADELQPELLQVLDPAALKTHHVRLSRKRLPIFRYFSPDFAWESLEAALCGRDQRQRHDPNPMFFQTLPKGKAVTHVLAHVRSLSLQYEGPEPIFGCLAVVDTRTSRKLTENFYFDLNTPMMRASLGPHREKEEAATLTKKALFHISNAHEAMVLVLRLERVFQGDPEAAMEPYLRHEKLKEKDAEKHRAHIRDVADNVCPKFGKYRQVFAWSWAPLFDAKGAVRATPAAVGGAEKPAPLFKELYPLSHKDNIIELIADLRDPKNAKKSYKTVAGSCDVALSRVEAPVPHLLDPSLAPVKLLEHDKSALPASLAPVAADAALVSKEAISAAMAVREQKGRGVSFAGGDKLDGDEEVVREVQEMPLLRRDASTEPFFSFLNNLYLHPASVNFSSEKNFKNIGIRFTYKDTDDDADAAGLTVFYGRSGCAAKSRESRSQVSFKNKSPSFTDEVKIALPARLTARHHILFTFYHLNVEKEGKKKGELPPEVLIGYAVLPVYPHSKIIENGTYTLSVVLGKLEPKYLSKLTSTDPAVRQSLALVDGGKPVFQVHVELLSTIYAQDAVLSALSKVYHLKEFFQDQELAECLDKFSLIPPHVALQHLPVIIHELLTVLGMRGAQAGLTAFKALVVLLNKVQGKLTECRPPRSSPLYVVLDFVLDNTRTSTQPYKSLSNNLLLFFMESRMAAAEAEERRPGESVDELYPVLWFLFDAIVKSMHLRLHDPSAPSLHDIEAVEPGLHRLIKRSLVAVVRATKASLAEIHRKATTPVIDPNAKDADKQLQALLEKQQADRRDAPAAAAAAAPAAAATGPRVGAQGLVIPMILDAAGAAEAYQTLSHVNRNIALFVRELCHVMDRGHMSDIIASVVTELSDAPVKGPGAAPPLPEVKELLDMVFSWKHDLLRLVFDSEHVVPFSCPMPYSVADLPPADLSDALSRKHPLSSLLVRTVLGDLKRKQRHTGTAIASLNQVLCKHDYDARYQDRPRRERVAMLYFVLVPMLIDDYSALRPWKEAADEEERRSFYVCVLYLIKNAKEQLLAWAMRETPARLMVLTEILADCIDAFQFNPLEKKIPAHLLRQKALLDEMLAGAVQLPVDEKHKFRNAKLSGESSLVVLDLLEDFIYTSRYFLNINSSALANAALASGTGSSPLSPRAPLSPRGPASPRAPLSPRGPASPRGTNLGFATNADLVNKIFYLLVRLLKRRQSEFFLSCMYTSLSTFCWKYRQLLFTNGAWCADLLREVIRHCSFASAKIRACATAFFYTFIKQCYFALGTFGRLSVQATTALSTLDNQGELAKEDRYLKRAFTTISRYALYDYGGIHVTLQDRQRSTTYLVELFARWVQGLAVTLTKTARDTIQVNEVEREKASDAELIADLYYRIAQGYTHIPDLRITWLEKLAIFQDKKEQFAEAGMCFVHIATLIWSYLSTFPDYADLKPYVAGILNPIAPGVLQQNIDWSAQDEISSSPHFCEKGLIAALKKAIYFLKQAEYYEYANELYKILVPMWERSENFKELQQAHDQLRTFFTTLWTVNETRLFGKYFRVGFYGSLFGDLDGREFVYREKGLTHLLDITERLKTTFAARFGATQVVVLADSRQVDRSTLDPQKAYLQITHLEPHLATDDYVRRRTFFKRNTGLREFIFVTPFTLAGKAHGPINEQYKRKTILTVDTAFPSLLKRLPVVSKREVVGSPIENAIEDIVARTISIDTELQRDKPNPKAVQSLLQGSVRLQVNQGAAEVARVFLGAPGSYNAEHVEALRTRMADFLQACANLLALNAKLTEESTDAREASFHEEMVNGYTSLSAEISPLISSEGPAPAPAPALTVSNAAAPPTVGGGAANAGSSASLGVMKRMDGGSTPTKKELKEAMAANKEAVKSSLSAADPKGSLSRARGGSMRGDDK